MRTIGARVKIVSVNRSSVRPTMFVASAPTATINAIVAAKPSPGVFSSSRRSMRRKASTTT